MFDKLWPIIQIVMSVPNCMVDDVRYFWIIMASGIVVSGCDTVTVMVLINAVG